MMNDFIYDIEVFPNVFLLTVEHAWGPLRWTFEISDWRHDGAEIMQCLSVLEKCHARLVGFNNVGFDYPILHLLVRASGTLSASVLYEKAQSIIAAQDTDRWMHAVKPSDRIIEQIDLFLIHHFDNVARATGLKVLEFNFRADTVEDLPYPIGTTLCEDQVSVLRKYNHNDIAHTKDFYHRSLDLIRFREELTQKYQRDFMNHNDTKIGKDYFIMRLEQSGVPCYTYTPERGREPRQTKRTQIALRDAILPWIEFKNPDLTRILNWLKDQVITETKAIFKDLTATVNGFEFVFGLGGIHGSVENRTVESTDDTMILDLDVSSYYPNLAIANEFFPAHLSTKFCEVYRELYNERKKYPKGSAENAMLKLALNGTYGDSNNPYSVFYDPLFTMSITLNGQLLLAMLAEVLMSLPSVEILQCNTDGITITCKRKMLSFVRAAYDVWSQRTRMELEETEYRKLCIRDVNNYIGSRDDGKIKRKGAYEYDLELHQNWSMRVVPMVAEQVLIHWKPIRETLENWPDKYDFMLRTKVPRTSYLSAETNGNQVTLQNVTRYYVAKGGVKLWKWMPPIKSNPNWRQIAIQAGWTVCVCNDIRDAVLPIDFDFYTQEVEKLVLPIM